MSKYIKLYDAIMAMDEWFSEPITPTKILSDLPTIEVSEDCISRADLLQQINLDAYGNEGQYGDEWKFLDTIENMPRVIPTTEQSSEVDRCKECQQYDIGYEDGRLDMLQKLSNALMPEGKNE